MSRALIDSKTIVVVNDNDFGVKAMLKDPVEGKKLKAYRVNDRDKLSVDDRAVATTNGIKPLENPSLTANVGGTLPEALR